MLSHGSALSKEEAAECRRIIDLGRQEYSWNGLADVLGLGRLRSFRDGHGSLGQVLKDFYNGAPTLELYSLCTQWEAKLQRRQAKEQNRMATRSRRRRGSDISAVEVQRIRNEVYARVNGTPGISRGWLAKHIKGDSPAVRTVIQSMLADGTLKDKYGPTARRSWLYLPGKPNNGPAPAPEATGRQVEEGRLAPASVAPEASKPAAPSPAPSWDSIRSKLLSAADDIKQMGAELSHHASLPAALRRDMEEVFTSRHDKLLKFIEEELE